PGELLELVVHARELLLDVLLRMREPLLDPGDVEEDSAVRAAAPLADLAHDAARHVVAGKELRRAAGLLVALGVAPSLFLVVGGLALVVRRNVAEHEPPPLAVAQHAALPADPF